MPKSRFKETLICLVNVFGCAIAVIETWLILRDAESVSFWHVLLLFLTFCITGFALYQLVVAAIEVFTKTISLRKRTKINKYIVNFIKHTGTTVILSRDLSWLNDKLIEDLKDKVHNHGDELIVFVPQPNKKSQRLEAFADVRYYNHKQKYGSIRLKSRFTIVHWDRDSMQLTYPQEDTKLHYNNEFSLGDPATTLATDIIRLLMQITTPSNNMESVLGTKI